MYPYTVGLINLSLSTSLYFRSIEIESSAWSQILYCLQIPTLKVFLLENLTIALLDVVFFLQRHPTITSLGLLLNLGREHGDGDCILPDQFNLPDLQILQASGVYAVLFMQHQMGHRFKEPL